MQATRNLHRPRRALAALQLALLAAAVGCAAPPGSHPGRAAGCAPGTTSPATDQPDATPLPDGWETCGTDGFERRLAAWRTGPPRELSASDHGRLQRALAQRDALAVRAVLLLTEVEGGQLDLIEHLEQRVVSSTRALDASDVVAAAALTGERGHDIPARLSALALPGDAHPDLEVRVECARAALFGGRTEVVPFLLQVLRTGTRDEDLDPPDWPRVETLAWVKSRAAEVLGWRAGVVVDFRPDGSLEHQEAEARRLELLLQDAR